MWLNNLDRKDKKVNVQYIVNDWINNYFNFDSNAWEFNNLSYRIISWCSNTDLTFYESDGKYKERFFLSLIKQINFLIKNFKIIPFNSSRILASAAIILSGLIFKENYLNLRIGLKNIEKFVTIYFDKNGFPKSRNPEEVFLCIKYLIMIRAWLKEAQEIIPEFIDDIISKCGNAYNFVTNSSKILPFFNGCTEINHENFDNYLKTLNYNFKNNEKEFGGLFKIKNKKFEIFFDVGEPPENNFSSSYQAGVLSFELSYNSFKIICNSGYGKKISKNLALLSRNTAAHSALYLENQSPVIFQKNKIINKIYGNSLSQSFKIKEKNINENENEFILNGRHNGYEKKFGYSHKRTLKILKKDFLIIGNDVLERISDTKNNVQYFIRFHIYPGSKIVKTKGGDAILIKINNGEGLLFKSNDNKVEIEKSVFLGGKNIINNECILISGIASEKKTSINWKIEKVSKK